MTNQENYLEARIQEAIAQERKKLTDNLNFETQDHSEFREFADQLNEVVFSGADSIQYITDKRKTTRLFLIKKNDRYSAFLLSYDDTKRTCSCFRLSGNHFEPEERMRQIIIDTVDPTQHLYQIFNRLPADSEIIYTCDQVARDTWDAYLEYSQTLPAPEGNNLARPGNPSLTPISSHNFVDGTPVFLGQDLAIGKNVEYQNQEYKITGLGHGFLTLSNGTEKISLNYDRLEPDLIDRSMLYGIYDLMLVSTLDLSKSELLIKTVSDRKEN